MNSFSDLVSSPVLCRNLAAHGYQNPTPIQSQSIPVILEGRDLVATAQTGTGKTLAFVLPMLERLLSRPRSSVQQALILTPTRELALQIHQALLKLCSGTQIRLCTIVGGINERVQLKALRDGANILIATPGRLCDFLDRKLVSLGTIEMLVLDEADRMLDMGFLPAVESIIKRTPASRQTLMFSATFNGPALRLIGRHMQAPARITIGSTSEPAANIDLRLYEVDGDRKLSLLQHLLTSDPGSFLVFSRTKHGAERLSKKLTDLKFKAASIHGDRSQNQRNQALKGFQDGYYRVLVATDVAARGIHVDNIAHVVNYDLPQAPEDFIHRVGRTGRAGAKGVASTFATRTERGSIRAIEQTLKAKLTRHDTPPDIGAEKPAAQVIVIPRAHGTDAGYAPRNDARAPGSFRARRRRFSSAR